MYSKKKVNFSGIFNRSYLYKIVDKHKNVILVNNNLGFMSGIQYFPPQFFQNNVLAQVFY